MRALVIANLISQGFVSQGETLIPPEPRTKAELRDLHRPAVAHRVARAKPGLQRHEARLMRRLANGPDVDPGAIRPRLVEVRAKSEDELLFRWAALHWSVPVSSGYGRRLRFLVIDDTNGALIGLIGLGDPVFALGARDRWIGWESEARRSRLHQLMDAFVLGSVPPYSRLLGGKLVALLATTLPVRHAFQQKYGGRSGRISRQAHESDLAAITTASALGRSSLYNRLRLPSRPVAVSLGMTRGWGDFQFSNGLYDALTAYAHHHCEPTAKNAAWGTGFRNRREVVKKALKHMGLSDDLLFHGIRREVFILPLARNVPASLRGDEALDSYEDTPEAVFEFFRERYLLPRAERCPDYREYRRESWLLWPERT